jgi:hypothetical protein
LNSIHMLLKNAKAEKKQRRRQSTRSTGREGMNRHAEVVLLNKCITNDDSNVLKNEDKSMGR